MRFSVNSPGASEDGGNLGQDDLDQLDAHSPAKGQVSLDSSISFICGALKRVGIDLSAKTQMDAGVCDALYTLLQMNHEKGEFISKLQVEVGESRQVVQLERKQGQIAKNELQARDKQLKAMENKTVLSDETVKHQLDTSRKLADDLAKRLKAAQKKIEIKEHQMKQKEVEYEKLQVVLRRHMEDKQSRHRQADQLIKGKVTGAFASSAGTAAAALASSSTALTSPRQARHDESIHGIVAVYESKQSELDKENKQLRTQLASLERKYIDSINKLEGREKALASTASATETGEATSIVDAGFIESIPTMSAGQLSAEIASRVKVLQRRIQSLEWHAYRFEATDGPPSIREKQLVEDLDAARSVLHDQGFMLTNVLTAMRKSIISEQQLYEAKMAESDRRREHDVEQAKRKFEQDRKTLDEENQAQVFCLKQEYEREVAYQKERIAKLEAEVASLEDKLHHMKSSHQVMLEEKLAAAQKEFDDKADGIRAGADATIESMAAEASRIQLDYKKTHNALREEAEALRNELAASQLAMRDMRAEVEARVQLDMRDTLEKELGSKFEAEFDAKLDARLKSELQAKERLDAAQLERLEASYSAKIDMLLREKQESDARTEVMDAELEIAKEQLSNARQEFERADRELAGLREREARLECEQREQRSASSIEAAKNLEKADSERRREMARLLEMVGDLEESLRAARQEISERDEVVRRSRLKEQEASMAVSKYDEMTGKYADLLKTYAPGLGTGGFLGRAIARRAVV